MDGQATTLPLAGLTPGTHVVMVNYAGDANYLGFPLVGEFGSPLIQVVRFPTTVELTSPSPLVYGQPISVTATVPESFNACPICNTLYPTGAITFLEGTNVLGVESLGAAAATLNLPGMSVGTHMITAIYSGDSDFAGSVAVRPLVVNRAATAVAVTSSLNPSILNQQVTFTANLSVTPPGSGTPTGSVTFADGVTTLGTVPLSSSGQVTLSTSALTVNGHSIVASYSGDSNFLSSSGGLTQMVQYEPAGTLCLGNPGHQILQPIRADGSAVFKQGSTVPARFRVCDVNGVSVSSPGVVTNFMLTQVITGTVSDSVQSLVDSNGPDSAFRWDATDQQWIFNISTKNLAAGSTYVFAIDLNDGTRIYFRFGLK